VRMRSRNESDKQGQRDGILLSSCRNVNEISGDPSGARERIDSVRNKQQGDCRRSYYRRNIVANIGIKLNEVLRAEHFA